jgi:signal peptidase I
VNAATLLKIAKVMLSAFAVAVLVAVASLTSVLPKLVGGASMTVLTGSMSPTIPAGSVVVVKPVDPAEVRPGDVITYQPRPGSAFVTHRVVRINDDDGRLSFVTKGDANDAEDPQPVPAAGVAGRVWLHVPHVGLISEKVRSPVGMTTLVAIPGLLYLVVHVRELLGERRARRGPVPEDEVRALPSAPVSTDQGGEPVISTADDPVVIRELMMASVVADAAGRQQVALLAQSFDGRVVYVDERRIVIAVTGTPQALDQMELFLDGWPERQTRRTGPIWIGALDGGAEAEVPAKPEEEVQRA